MVLKNYSGWANYETWNVALHIHNNEQIYRFAVDFMKSTESKQPFKDFVSEYGLISTADGVLYGDELLDTKDLDKMMRELVEYDF